MSPVVIYSQDSKQMTSHPHAIQLLTTRGKWLKKLLKNKIKKFYKQDLKTSQQHLGSHDTQTFEVKWRSPHYQRICPDQFPKHTFHPQIMHYMEFMALKMERPRLNQFEIERRNKKYSIICLKTILSMYFIEYEPERWAGS